MYKTRIFFLRFLTQAHMVVIVRTIAMPDTMAGTITFGSCHAPELKLVCPLIIALRSLPWTPPHVMSLLPMEWKNHFQ